MNWFYFKSAVFNSRMLSVIVVVLIIYFHELFINGNYFGLDWGSNQTIDILEIQLSIFALSFFSITAGMFPGIPYAFSLLEERNSGYLRYVLSRMSTNDYIKKKILWVGVSGGISMIIPYLILLIPISIAGIPTTVEVHPFIMEDMIWGDVLYIWGGYFVILLKGLLILLFGILWAELSLLLSLFVRNRYIAFILPFTVFELCWLMDPINGSLRTINPLYMINSHFDVNDTFLAQPFIFFIIYIIMVSVACVIIFRKQVRDGNI